VFTSLWELQTVAAQGAITVKKLERLLKIDLGDIQAERISLDGQQQDALSAMVALPKDNWSDNLTHALQLAASLQVGVRVIGDARSVAHLYIDADVPDAAPLDRVCKGLIALHITLRADQAYTRMVWRGS
jgi:hypothetical protein